MKIRSAWHRHLARRRGRRYRRQPPPVRYRAFAERTDEGFDEFVQSRVERPLKTQLIVHMLEDPDLPREFRILDVGAGPGVFAQAILRSALADRVRYTAVDQSENALAYLDRTTPDRFTTICRDVVRDGLPADEAYDVVVVNEVFEHVADFRPLLPHLAGSARHALAISTFAVVPGLSKDRVLWDGDHHCFKNSYPFDAFLSHLEDATQAPVCVMSFGGIDTRSFWFPRKAYATWYSRLGAPRAADWGEGASMPAPRS